MFANDKHFNFIHSNVAFIVDVTKIVTRNIGDNIIWSKKFTQSFKSDLYTSGDKFVASNNFKLFQFLATESAFI